MSWGDAWSSGWWGQQWSSQPWGHEPSGQWGQQGWTQSGGCQWVPVMPVVLGTMASPPGQAPLQGKGISPSPAEKGIGKGKGKSSGQGALKGKGTSPSPEEGQGQDKGKGKKGKGKSPMTPEEAKEARKKRQKRIQLTDRSNTLKDGDFRMPWYHRRGRVQPGKLRKITERLVGTWKILEWTMVASTQLSHGNI